jgi:hypothetical protein
MDNQYFGEGLCYYTDAESSRVKEEQTHSIDLEETNGLSLRFVVSPITRQLFIQYDHVGRLGDESPFNPRQGSFLSVTGRSICTRGRWIQIPLPALPCCFKRQVRWLYRFKNGTCNKLRLLPGSMNWNGIHFKATRFWLMFGIRIRFYGSILYRDGLCDQNVRSPVAFSESTNINRHWRFERRWRFERHCRHVRGQRNLGHGQIVAQHVSNSVGWLIDGLTV